MTTAPPKRRRRTKAEIERARRRREANRRHRLKVRHRMTPEQYDLILAFQGGRCYICPARGKTRALAVDHDHEKARRECDHAHEDSCSNCWRGLLCAKCNGYMAYVRDDPDSWRRGRQYLLNPPAQQALIAEEGTE